MIRNRDAVINYRNIICQDHSARWKLLYTAEKMLRPVRNFLFLPSSPSIVSSKKDAMTDSIDRATGVKVIEYCPTYQRVAHPDRVEVRYRSFGISERWHK